MQGKELIVDLREVPQLTPAVVDQNYETWGAMSSLGREEMAELFRADTPLGQLPETWVAVVAGQYVGCASLRAITLGAVRHPQWYIAGVGPWLSNMWVAPDARGCGLATRLTMVIEERARARRVPTLYSSTAEGNSLYHRLGFRTTDEITVDTGTERMTMYMIRKDLVR